MCDRVAQTRTPEELAQSAEAQVEFRDEIPARRRKECLSRRDIRPGGDLYAVAVRDEGRVLSRYKWGLVPSWARNRDIGGRLYNAKGESIAEKPSFREAFLSRTWVIPVDGFYVWDQRPRMNRRLHFFTRSDGQPVLLAGLYEYWHDSQNRASKPLLTCTIVTTKANDDMNEIHDRMPVVLELVNVKTWINVEEHPRKERLSLVNSIPGGVLMHRPVSRRQGQSQR